MVSSRSFASRKAPRRIAAVALAAGLLVGTVAMAAPASAGPSHGGSTSSVTPVPLNSPDGQAHYGGQVTFKVVTSATDKPYVKLDCYQGGVYVYWSSAGFFPSYPWPWAQDFTLSSQYWTSGAANCIATLYYAAGHNKFPTLATANFTVAA